MSETVTTETLDRLPSLLDPEYQSIADEHRRLVRATYGRHGVYRRYAPAITVRQDPEPDVEEPARSGWPAVARRKRYSGSEFGRDTNTLAHRRRTDDDRQFEADVRRLWDSGSYTLDSLAEHFGEPVETIAEVLTARQRAGIYNEPARNRPLLDDDGEHPRKPRETLRERMGFRRDSFRDRMKERRREEGGKLGW